MCALFPDEQSASDSTTDRGNRERNARLGEPYVEKSDFAHKGGMHIDGVNRYPNRSSTSIRRVSATNAVYLMSEVSGRTTLLKLIQKIDPSLKKDSPQTKVIIQTLKELEHDGISLRRASASFELVVRKELDCPNRFSNWITIRYSENLPQNQPANARRP
jgi:2-isopropylmalate synthase